MPKRVGQLWETLTSWENLYLAYRKAGRGKRHRSAVAQFDFQLERELTDLQRELLAGTYQPGKFHSFVIHEPKRRVISAAPFRDRVVHHAFCNVVEPVFERSFIFDSYACRQGKGTHAALERYTEFSRRNKYVLKCDVRKFFPSIDHALLKSRLARKLKDPKVLRLADTIIDHTNQSDAVAGYFPGDDLFTQSERRRGLPLGNQTSQFFANIFLDQLDHFAKETLRCQAYIRYCDDFVILENDKRRLREIREAVESFLHSIRLWLHPTKRQISRVRDGLPFLGFRIWPAHRLLTRAGLVRLRAHLLDYQQRFRCGQLSARDLTQRIQACVAHASHANTWRLRAKLLGDMV